MNIIDVATWLTLACLPAFLLLDLAYRARRFQTPVSGACVRWS